MYIEKFVPYPNLASYISFPTNTQIVNNSKFDSYIKILESKMEVEKHLQGVPMETVSIAPSILEKMSTDSITYNKVMESIDIYVKTYKERNTPGVETITFSIDENCVPCIKGVNEIVKKLCTESINADDYNDYEFKSYKEKDISKNLKNTTLSYLNYELALTYYYKKNILNYIN